MWTKGLNPEQLIDLYLDEKQEQRIIDESSKSFKSYVKAINEIKEI